MPVQTMNFSTILETSALRHEQKFVGECLALIVRPFVHLCYRKELENPPQIWR